VNIPLELGYLFYQGKKRNGRFSLEGVILYRQPLSVGSVILWTVITFVAVLALFVLSAPLTSFLETAIFSGIPDWFKLDTGLEGGFSTRALWIVNIASLIVFVVGISITEELYFRGYLLPRLSHLRLWAVLLNSFLFALYHFTTPWLLVTRLLITLPLAYTAYRKQSLLPSIVVHAIANSIDPIMGFLYLLGV